MKLVEKKSYDIQLDEEEVKKWKDFYFLMRELYDAAEPNSNFVREYFENILETMDYINKEYLDVLTNTIKLD